MTNKTVPFTLAALILGMLMLMGNAGDGCAVNSTTPAPNVNGQWTITYDNMLNVEVDIGASVSTAQLGPQGGTFSVTYQGQQIDFNLDCTRPDVICPSQAWPQSVTASQQDVMYEHQMTMTLPTSTCVGTQVAAMPSQCGTGTDNPNCDPICNGTVVVQNTQRFGVIGADGSSFRLYLGGGIVTNGVNCAMLGYSVADANLTTTGQGTSDWEATGMTGGLVTIGYAGGCLYSGTDPNMKATLESVGAAIKFTTGFTGTRQH